MYTRVYVLFKHTFVWESYDACIQAVAIDANVDVGVCRYKCEVKHHHTYQYARHEKTRSYWTSQVIRVRGSYIYIYIYIML